MRKRPETGEKEDDNDKGRQGIFEFLCQGIFLSRRGARKHGHSRWDDQQGNENIRMRNCESAEN